MNMCVLTASSHWFGCCCGGWLVHSRYMSFPVESAFCFFFLSISFVSFNFEYKKEPNLKKPKRRKEVFCNRFLYIIIILKKINKKENKSFFSVYMKII